MRTKNTDNKEMSLEETMEILSTLKLSKKEQEDFLFILKEYDMTADFSPEGTFLSVETM